MNLEEYNIKFMELKEILNDAVARNIDGVAPESEVEAARAAYDYHISNKDTLITEVTEMD